jgi:hypothetical protein
MSIDRKTFMRQSAALGGCCGAALLTGSLLDGAGLPGKPAAAAGACAAGSVSDGGATACEARLKQGQDVIKRLVVQLDAQLDAGRRDAILEACGRLCHEGSHPPGPPPTPERRQRFLDALRRSEGADHVRETAAGTVVELRFTQNPAGLETADGHCLCPIFEDAPKDVPALYCQCSVGYVRSLFEQGLGRPARVELTESVLRGGKTCAFTVTVPADARP